MKRIVLYPYKLGSGSAKKIQARLTSLGYNTLRVRGNGTYRPRPTDKIINWGNTKNPTWGTSFLNKTTATSVSTNKVTALLKMKLGGVSVPDFTIDMRVASNWAGKIVARTLTRASSGRGIVMCTSRTLVRAPLYTKFIDKDSEYRVHIFNGELIDYAKKVPMGEKNDVCSHDNGYLFIRNIKHLDENIVLAKSAVRVLGLDFGAVDIIRKDGVSYVLEVNTAPGMEETTLSAYVKSIIK